MYRILLISFLLIGYSTFSQEAQIGIKTGLNFSTISGENSNEIEGRTAYHIGVVLEVPIGKSLKLAPEIIFSSQGAKFTTRNKYTYSIARNDYLNLPVLLRYYLSKGFMFETGPQVGILISSKLGNTSTDISPNFKNQDYGFNLGLGYKTEVGIGINFRYYMGLAKIDDFNNRDFNNKNRVFQISLFYLF